MKFKTLDCSFNSKFLFQFTPDQTSIGPPPPPLSPISETVHDTANNGANAGANNLSTCSKASNASSVRSCSAAVSDESVAGDSGVYEASPRAAAAANTTTQQRSSRKQQLEAAAAAAAAAGLSSMSLETAQVKIKLRYSAEDALLHVGIERARNLGALFIPENRKM